MVFDEQDIPDYCVLVLDGEETTPTSVIAQDGMNRIEPQITEEYVEFQFLLNRADNGRGNGEILYSNSKLPIGEGYNYALVEIIDNGEETQPIEDYRILPGSTNEKDDLVFEISDFSKRGNFRLYKVLSIEEVEKCNKFLEEKIDLDELFTLDGFVYIPLENFGITDVFTIGIKAPSDKTSGSNSDELGLQESDDPEDDDNGSSNQNDDGNGDDAKPGGGNIGGDDEKPGGGNEG